ncbi:hypothetical protein H8F25_06875 [Synechococcus sp. CBW1004]|jgi:hypothetical protein|nr:hypothetical protein H8F25_06875 [Synechococcus sp. CBW1004]
MDSSPHGHDFTRSLGLKKAGDRRQSPGDRRAEPRYAPDEGVVEVVLLRCCSGEVLPADLLDISHSAVRLAIHPGVQMEPGDRCLLCWKSLSGEEDCLEGMAVRVQAHDMITVVVISFQGVAAGS